MKKGIFLLLIMVAMSAASIANAADDISGRPADITCEGNTVYQRPMWQKILSMGLLGDTVSVRESGFYPAFPGGLDSVRKTIERNKDFGAFVAGLIRLLPSHVMQSEVICKTGNGQTPLQFIYHRECGLMMVDVED